jgi:hypothetical protein
MIRSESVVLEVAALADGPGALRIRPSSAMILCDYPIRGSGTTEHVRV